MRNTTGSEKVLLIVAVLLCVVASACSLDRWVDIAAGAYTLARNGASASVSPEIRAVVVDRDNSTVWLQFTDGTLLLRQFVPRSRRAWPAGCPTNLNSTRMEVLKLGEQALPLPSTIVEQPVLVRGCPRDPVSIVLRDDGKIGGGAAACYGADQCLRFEPASEAPELPHSMKGYELYSWRVSGADEWQHTLITGTNRWKSYSEVTSPASKITQLGIAKITVQGTDALLSVLSFLPDGESVTWQDVRGLADAPGDAGAFTDRRVLREVSRYARRSGIDLALPD